MSNLINKHEVAVSTGNPLGQHAIHAQLHTVKTGIPLIRHHARTLELPLLVRSVVFFFLFVLGAG